MEERSIKSLDPDPYSSGAGLLLNVAKLTGMLYFV
jgi:hypothetical protein